MKLREVILNIAEKQTKFKTSDVVKKLKGKLTRQYVSSIINSMVKEGVLLKRGTTYNAFYALFQNASLLEDIVKMRLKNDNLEEDKVYSKLEKQANFIQSLEKNVSDILFYAFTEMLNNAIEHSKSKYIQIEIKRNQQNLTFAVNDFGIGVFKNVMQKRKLNSELEAIQDLLKGKTTTNPCSHSGEGIFFTSKAGDIFILESFGYRLRVDNIINDIFIEELKPQKRGTKVIFTISFKSEKNLNDIFSKFQTKKDEIAFDKTEIKVRLFTMGTTYISRSQARRILSGLDKYKTIILDFDRVSTVGQAFADEIFRVFQQRHTNINIQPINMIKPVKFMIDRVKK